MTFIEKLTDLLIKYGENPPSYGNETFSNIPYAPSQYDIEVGKYLIEEFKNVSSSLYKLFRK